MCSQRTVSVQLCTANSETNAQTAPPSAICQAITLYKLASQFWKHIAFGFSSKSTEIVLNIVSQDFLSSYYVTTFTAMNHPMIYNAARETLRSANRAVFYQKQRVTTYKADKCEDKFFQTSALSWNLNPKTGNPQIPFTSHFARRSSDTGQGSPVFTCRHWSRNLLLR